MIFTEYEEGRRYRKLSKILTDFPWLWAINHEWLCERDKVQISDRTIDLRLLLLSPARNDGTQLWLYREFMSFQKMVPSIVGTVLVPHSDGKTLWVKRVMEITASLTMIRFVATKFPCDGNYTIYRAKEGSFNGWIEYLSEKHSFKEAVHGSERAS